jgi:protein gp37
MSGQYWDQGVNLVEGCTPVSAGCKNCWAAQMAHRLKKTPWLLNDKGRFNGKVVCHSERLSRFQVKTPTIFSIWNDLFHEEVSGEFVDEVGRYAQKYTHHKYLILTKRPDRMQKYFADLRDRVCSNPPYHDLNIPNVWCGVSAEHQRAYENRVPPLTFTPAGGRFLSLEPLLGPIDLNPNDLQLIDWVIAGAETGPGARPAELDWFRSLRDQCAAANVPFWLKAVDNKGNRLLDGREHNGRPEGM